MAQAAGATSSLAGSAFPSEKHAMSTVFAATPSAPPTPAAPKIRSCVVCRSRKVRCDKQLPCSNCRRANIACVFPSTDRPPRWARRLDRLTNHVEASNLPAGQDGKPGVDKVMERVRNLESLVKELRGQLEQAHAAARSASTTTQDPVTEHQKDSLPDSDTSGVQQQFGRLVLQDANRSRYVSSGFWSRVDDELDGLKMDAYGLDGDGSDSSEDETLIGKDLSHEHERTPSERHAFIFGHNLNTAIHNFKDLHPLPSQIPFLLDVFSENVNLFIRIVHLPTVEKMVRDWRASGMAPLAPANEALMFSIYYAAIASMEEDDIMTNFGCPKVELSLKYRLGLEHALAKADFLNVPDIVVVQALVLFLLLARRHESPRFVWMMTGLVVRIGQYLGLQRDGAHFGHLSPFDLEMRRKVWWALHLLDVRTSEDQGTDLAIATGSFDTKIPLNLNDADLLPETRQMPSERNGVTDMSFARISAGITHVMRQLMASGMGTRVKGLEDQRRLLNEIHQNFEREYLQYKTEAGNIAYWVTATIARMIMAKMTLIVFLPVLFSSPSEDISDEIRTKLLISAIEVAEYNHALNAEQAGRKWRWLYQTCTHWHAIVFLMIETSRRPWSPLVERAWVALHSSWLIPAQKPIEKNLRIWVPLRRLAGKVRQHRNNELKRLRADPQAAARLDTKDQRAPVPSSSGPFSPGSAVDIFRERWRQLVSSPDGREGSSLTSGPFGENANPSPIHTIQTMPSTAGVTPDLNSSMAFELAQSGTNTLQLSQAADTGSFKHAESAFPTDVYADLALEQPAAQSAYSPFPTALANWSDGRTMGTGFVPLLWAETDVPADAYSNANMGPVDANMELDGEVNWYDWVEFAKGMEWDASPSGRGWS